MSSEETAKTDGQAAPVEPEMHNAPSMLWMLIPLGLIVAFAMLSR